jgi:hypothetical protein
MTGTTRAFSLRAASSPPAKSTTNRQAKWLRFTPTCPPTPVRVAITVACFGPCGLSRHQ